MFPCGFLSKNRRVPQAVR
uniref:Uncharacterized protein n=1 Tax=Anguilla anguilla TaxID=7936 RepID=A0A0E9X9W9_ANGAN